MRIGRPTLFFAFAALAASGCLSGFHPLPESQRLAARPGCAACRQRVHVFLVHGLDLFDYANLEGIRDRLVSLGYDARLFQHYESAPLAGALRDTRRAAPGEPIALVGFSVGCGTVRDVTNRLHEEEGFAPDLLFYIGGWMLADDARSRPPFVPRVVHVLGKACDLWGGPLTGADNIRLSTLHYDSPTEAPVLQRLEMELERLAQCPAHGPHGAVQLGVPRVRAPQFSLPPQP